MKTEKINKYWKTKIGRNMLITFLLLVIPMVCVNLGLQRQSRNNIRQEIIKNYFNSLSMSADQFSDRLEDLRQLTISLTVDDDLNALCISNDNKQNLYRYLVLQRRLSAYMLTHKLSADISVVFPKQKWVVSINSGIYSYNDIPDRASRIQDASLEDKWSIRPRMVDPNDTCLSVVTGYVHDKQTNPIFYLEIDEASISSSLKSLNNSDTIVKAFVLDTSGAIYGSDSVEMSNDDLQSIIAQKLSLNGLEQVIDTDSDQLITFNSGDRRFDILLYPLSHTDCTLGIVVDDKEISQPIRSLYLWSMTSVLIFAVIAFLYVRISNRQIVRPIEGLQATMQKIGEGDFSVSADDTIKNEFGDIGFALNQMAVRLQTTIDEKYIEEIRLAQTQLQFLRVQINPHFLYNSLFTLYTFIKNEDLDSAADLSIYLGQYFQINAKVDNSNVYLYKELEHIQLLVKIQNMRFEDRIVYTENIDPDLKMLMIPRLSILTLTENFLTHGIKNLKGKALLNISVCRKSENIEISVVDNGEGMTEEQLQRVRQDLEHISFDQQMLHGLQNVLLQTRAMYGNDSRMELEQNTPCGLIVRLIFRRKELE